MAEITIRRPLYPAEEDVMSLLASGNTPKKIAWIRKVKIVTVLRQMHTAREALLAKTRDEALYKYAHTKIDAVNIIIDRSQDY
jgi:DNA-binding CsgD family transcriptional regulator